MSFNDESVRSPITGPFQHAVELTRSIYDYAAIHIVAEGKERTWTNRYTSVVYGRRSDIRSIPNDLEAKRYRGQRILCLRKLVPRADAETFLSGAIEGKGRLAPWNINYDLEPAITGFRPKASFGSAHPSSFWNASTWTRERIGRRKEFGGRPLTRENVWRIVAETPFLQQIRWSVIPLHRFPEKLCDLDEFWPAPISFESRGPLGSLEIEITHDVLALESGAVTISGTLLRDGLAAGYINLFGKGPHKVPIGADGADLTLCVDGVPLDGSAGYYIRQVLAQVGLDTTGQRYQVPGEGGRPAMEFPVGYKDSQTVKSGTDRRPSVRPEAWAIGAWYREDQPPQDAERVYDPETGQDTVRSAFEDLKNFGAEQAQPNVVVMDPYAFDERALRAIAMIATRPGRARRITLVTQFDPEDTEASPSTEDRDAVKAESKREQEIAKAKNTATLISAELQVKFVFYRAQRLHDRFLLVGDRMWHVGPSFNKLGEELSAIIEMRDEQRKAQVREALGRFTSGPIVFETP